MVEHDAQDTSLSRWPVLVAAVLIALAGLFSSTVRDSRMERTVHSADRNDAQQISKREPIRALVTVERRDGGPNHWHSADGALAPIVMNLRWSNHAPASLSATGAAVIGSSFWPGPLPRAPPAFA